MAETQPAQAQVRMPSGNRAQGRSPPCYPPAVIHFSRRPTLPPIADRAAIERLAEFDQIIDVRTPAEFALDHIPGASNHPVLDDAQRVQIGTLYKQDSPFTAKKLGAALVARNIADHLERDFAGKPRGWRPLIYCWRGGKRSGAMTHILREVGWDARQLDGGYKAYRRHIVQDLPERAGRLRLRVICGLTGSGKSRLLRALAAAGQQVLDLEADAVHKGSVLGNEPGAEQPSQKMFESRVWDALRRLDPERVVYVESESKRIGSVRVPEALIDAMWASHCVWVEASVAHRVALLKEEYTHFLADPQALIDKLLCLKALHGAEVIERWCGWASTGRFDELVADLLERHYDPTYTRSINAHYAHLPEAIHGSLNGIADADFQTLAQALIRTH